jgi:small-conductance mechanosensitive channel
MAVTSNPSAGDHVFRSALICIMVGCILLSLVSLIQLFVPDWDGTFLIVFCVLTAAEAYVSFRIFRQDQIFRFDSGRILAIELAGLYLLLQLCIDLIDGNAPFQNYFPHLDGKTAGLFVIVLLTWLLVTDTARDLDRLSRPSEGRIDFVPAERRLSSRFFAGGIVLFALSGLTQVRIAEAIKLPTPSASGPVANVLLYFLLGVLFLGHVHYTSLRGRWQRGDITVASGIGSRWVRYCLVFVGLVAVVAFLLPTSHTLGLLDVGRAIWNPVSNVLVQIILTVRGPLTWLLRFFGGKAPATRPRVLPPHLPPHLSIPPRHHGSSGHGGGVGITLIKSLLFWGVIVAVAVYLLRTFKPRNIPRIPILGGMLHAVRGALVNIWAALLARFRGYVATVVERVPGARALSAVPSIIPRGRLPFTRVGSLPPREQVIYYYLSVVRRAHRQGIDRRGSQTPHEFSAHLAPRLAEAGSDLETLTDAFVEARYSRHDLPDLEVGRIRASWQRVRAALRGARNRLDTSVK